MELYFAYGSNMSSARLGERLASVRALGRARASGWSLTFDKPGRDGTSKANLVARPDAHVWGVVYELRTEDWPALDRYERDYRRAGCIVETPAGERLETQAYFFDSDPGRPAARPSRDYLAHLLAGASEHGLPEDHVRVIQSFARP